MTESSAASMVANFGSLDISVLRGYLKGIDYLKEIDLRHPSTNLNYLHFRWELQRLLPSSDCCSGRDRKEP